jgi:hypothetical protein
MADPTTIGAATLYCGDCLEVMAGMDADSATINFTLNRMIRRVRFINHFSGERY